ncbi:MAG: phospholipase D-like domain-containing protein, partial [Prosthecobacter sp.]|nr:phospholipase D-like domain-containing protein [Prosthecobacter sp.]
MMTPRDAARLPSLPRLAILLPLLSLVSCATGRLQRLPEQPPPVSSAAFAEEAARLAGHPWREGNAVTTLPNGVRFLPAMLAAIRSARHSITWENFVAVDSQPVADFTEALCERAEAGVKVHVILDHYGCSTYGKEHLRRMRAAGVDLRLYSPWRLHRPLAYNHRTHRRILVVDGQVGYIGGAGLAYAWDGDAEDPTRWRDTMYELRGPVVADLQRTFHENWQELTGQTLTGAAYFPPLTRQGSSRVLNAPGSPQSGQDTIGSLFLLALRAARTSILISHAYFIPSREFEIALVEARARGVEVEILVPGPHTDMPLCPCVTAPLLRQLLDAGVTLREYQPCMMHGKLVVIDGALSIIGSGNLDARSFFINDENNALVLCQPFARQQIAMHRRDCQRSRLITRADLRQSWLPWLKGA